MLPETKIIETETVEFNKPVILEGLPGIGFVGKIVVDQIVKQLDATKFAELESDYFPPQVSMQEKGLIEPMKNEFFYLKEVGKDKIDLIILTGNSQGSDFEGQTAISKTLVDYFEHLQADRIFTLGGLGTGEMIEKSKVFVAGNDLDLVNQLLKIDNTEIRKDEGGFIVGASGLILHYAQKKDIKAACLMGETPGFYIDPSAAKEVLLVLFELLKFEIDLDELNEQVEDTLKRLANTPQLAPMGVEPQLNKPNDDLRYIG
ncbi:MAG: proteasome assembly chaperone family protein [Methanosphaera sp. rholeuAM74]|nr:MAG: proteasome assembly chaperone family protein [Methanosphaera sp. rholeuAM74]